MSTVVNTAMDAVGSCSSRLSQSIIVRTMGVTVRIMAQRRARKHQANGIEKAMFKGLFEDVSAEMRNVRQHLRFSIDPFDQTAYAFRHNGNMRPAVAKTFRAFSFLPYPTDARDAEEAREQASRAEM